MPMGFWWLYANPTHKHGELSPIATKNAFIINPVYSKRCVMYGEHLNGDMIEIDSHNVDFFF